MPPTPGDYEPVEPDYRFTLANERTFLAWMRTAWPCWRPRWRSRSTPRPGLATFRDVCAVVLALLATSAAAGGLWRWRSVQDAMRRGGPVRGGSLVVVVAAGLAVVTLAVLGVLAGTLGR